MPIDYGRYPADWRAIRARILARAGDRCEWCAAPDRQIIVRDDPHTEDAQTVDKAFRQLHLSGTAAAE